MKTTHRGWVPALFGCAVLVSSVLLGGCQPPEAPRDPNIPPPLDSPVPPSAPGTGAAPPQSGSPAPDGPPR